MSAHHHLQFALYRPSGNQSAREIVPINGAAGQGLSRSDRKYQLWPTYTPAALRALQALARTRFALYRWGGMDNYICAHAMHLAYASREESADTLFILEGALKIPCVTDWASY